MSIFAVSDTALLLPFPAIIRKEDVRSDDVDRVEMHTSFVPGDILKARVISLGDARSFFLSTAEEELGFYMGVFKHRGTDILAQASLLLPHNETHVRVVDASEEEKEEGAEGKHQKKKKKKSRTFKRKVAKPVQG